MAQTLLSLIFKPEPSYYVPIKAATNEEFPSKDRWYTNKRGFKVTQHLHGMQDHKENLFSVKALRNPPLFSSPDSCHCY